MSDLVKERSDRSSPAFSVGNRLRRMVWGYAYALLFRPSPRLAFEWRSMLLRAFGAKVGVRGRIYPKCNIWAPWNLDLGDDCGIGDGATLYSMDLIKIGHRTTVSQGGYLCCGTHNYNDPKMPLVTRPIIVGDDAWICAEAFVFPGVTIGDGGIVGARGVATRNIPEWTVWAGNPCVQRGTRKRFPKP